MAWPDLRHHIGSDVGQRTLSCPPRSAAARARAASNDASGRAYGRPRIWKDLAEEGERVREKRVGRLMREVGVVSAVNDRHLTIKALEMAITRRCPEAGLLHHSDQGPPLAQRAPGRLEAAR